MTVDAPAQPIDQPAQTPLMAADVAAGLITLRNLFFPWEDLNAQDVPAQQLKAHPDVVLTLSMLAAMKDGVPSLVQYDDAGRVLATGDRVAGPHLSCPPAQTSTLNVPLASGTESLDVYVTDPNGASGTNSMSVVGHDSTFVYVGPFTSSKTLARWSVQVDHAFDRSVDVVLVNGNGVQFVDVNTVLVKAVNEVTIFSNPGQEPTVKLLTDTSPQANLDLPRVAEQVLGANASVIVWTPNAGNRIRLSQLVVSNNALSTMSAFLGAVEIGRWYGLANVPTILPFPRRGLIAGAVNGVLTVKTGNAAAVAASAYGNEE